MPQTTLHHTHWPAGVPRTLHHTHWPAGVPRTLEASDGNLFSLFAAQALGAPDKTAIDYYGRLTSYRDLHEAVLNLAGYMQQRLGVWPGDRVLILMQNCPQFAIAYYAILRCDAVVVSMHPMSTPDEIAHCMQDSGGRVVITMQDLQPRVESFLADGRLTGCIVGAYAEMAGSAADVPFMQVPAFVLEPRCRPDGSAPRLEVHDFSGALAAGIAPINVITPLTSEATQRNQET